MSEDLKVIADAADAIFDGYAYTRDGAYYRVLNLNNPASAAVLSSEGEMVETTMDDIELALVQDYFARLTAYLAA